MTMQFPENKSSSDAIGFESPVDKVSANKKELQRQENYTKAMDSVGTNLAKDVIKTANNSEPVNKEQFIRDMLTNPAFSKSILQECATNPKMRDLIQQGGLKEVILAKNSAVIDGFTEWHKNPNNLGNGDIVSTDIDLQIIDNSTVMTLKVTRGFNRDGLQNISWYHLNTDGSINPII